MHNLLLPAVVVYVLMYSVFSLSFIQTGTLLPLLCSHWLLILIPSPVRKRRASTDETGVQPDRLLLTHKLGGEDKMYEFFFFQEKRLGERPEFPPTSVLTLFSQLSLVRRIGLLSKW